jgi:hypothetical protein
MRSLRVRTVLADVAAAVLAARRLRPRARRPSGPGAAVSLESSATERLPSTALRCRRLRSCPGPRSSRSWRAAASAPSSSPTAPWTWGDNFFGVLGDGSTGGSRPTPGQVPGLSGITQVAISYNGGDLFALGPDGVVWGWGLNGEGQLGDGTTTQRRTPVQVPGLTGDRPGVGEQPELRRPLHRDPVRLGPQRQRHRCRRSRGHWGRRHPDPDTRPGRHPVPGTVMSAGLDNFRSTFPARNGCGS